MMGANKIEPGWDEGVGVKPAIPVGNQIRGPRVLLHVRSHENGVAAYGRFCAKGRLNGPK